MCRLNWLGNLFKVSKKKKKKKGENKGKVAVKNNNRSTKLIWQQNVLCMRKVVREKEREAVVKTFIFQTVP